MRPGALALNRSSLVSTGQAEGRYKDVATSFLVTTSGQGFFFDVSPSQTTLFAAWYTYAPNGQAASGSNGQRWFTLQDNHYVVGSRTSNATIYSASGGLFDHPSAVSTTPVGTAITTFVSCTAATISYTFNAGELVGQSGTIQLKPVVAVPGCQ